MSVASQPVRVLYIAGAGRSGSTIIANALAQADGFVSIGEASLAWRRGIIEGRYCGCGQRFTDCPQWREAFTRAFGGFDSPDPRRMDALRQQVVHPRHYGRVRQAVSQARQGRPAGQFVDFVAALSRLYAAIRDVTGSRVIIDGSKVPAYGHLLEAVPGLEVSIVHLVRDARAVAYSRLTAKHDPDTGEPLPTAHALPVAAAWVLWNIMADQLWGTGAPVRHLRVRYEDFAARPAAILRMLADFAGEPGATLPHLAEGRLQMVPPHTVSGNPARFTEGSVIIRPDYRWLAQMRARDRLAVTALAWPLLRRYGYLLAPLREERP